MKLPSFRDCLEDDIDNVFFNEFATVIFLDGKEVQAVKDDEELSKYNSSFSDGITQCEYYFIVPTKQLLKPIFTGKTVEHEGQIFRVEDAWDDDGVTKFVLKGVNQ